MVPQVLPEQALLLSTQQLPFRQAPPVHVVPSGAVVGVGHWPVVGMQLPATMHVAAEHDVGVPAEHLPDLHTSFVHMLPSRSHPVPSAFMPYEQVPLEHVPGEVLHWSGGLLQGICGPATQAPLWQASFWVQALLSALQDEPSDLLM
jgi:hypothetical protein